MGKRRKLKQRCYVDHPRYGNEPIKSGFNFTKEEIDHSFWGYQWLNYFPYTAIPANIEKQNYSTYPRSLYVDIEASCEVCNRLFIFFAKEQQYWYEELGFYVDASCNRCTDCRKNDQKIRSMQLEYELLNANPNRSEKDNRQLKTITMELYQLGYIKHADKINRIKLNKGSIPTKPCQE